MAMMQQVLDVSLEILAKFDLSIHHDDDDYTIRSFGF
jgi:hypothetical protein